MTTPPSESGLAGAGARLHDMFNVMSKSVAARKSVQRYRDRMRESGFRLVQLWVPDTRAEGFGEGCRRQSRAARRRRRVESDVLDWIEANRDVDGWKP